MIYKFYIYIFTYIILTSLQFNPQQTCLSKSDTLLQKLSAPKIVSFTTSKKRLATPKFL